MTVGHEFIEWWFQQCQTKPLIWECPPGKIGEGQLRTLNQTGFINYSKSDIYFRTTTVETIPKTGRGGSKLAGQIPGFWLDIDFKEGLNKSDKYPLRGQAEDLIGQLPDPSATVETGGGLHCYWKFDEPVSTLPNLGVLECWHAFVSNIWQSDGFLLDNVSNPDRLMRLPGSVNWKQNDFLTVAAINDLTYSVDELIGLCDAPKPVDAGSWIDAPSMRTAFNETIDAAVVWKGLGLSECGQRTNPDGTFFLRPGSEANKSVTVWSDTQISTIHSTVVTDKLQIDKSHISAFDLAEAAGMVEQFRPAASKRLESIQKEFDAVLNEARNGVSPSGSRWCEAVNAALLAERLRGVRPEKESLVRAFPDHLLPNVVKRACDVMTRSTGAPPEMVYPFSLGVVSLAVQGRVRVDLYDTPLSLYMLIAAPPGAGKSVLLRLFTKALNELDKELLKRWRPHRKRFIKEFDELQETIFKKKEQGEDVTELENKFDAAKAATVPPSVLLGKMTPAALYEQLGHRKSIGVSSSEGADWLSNLRDSNNGEVTGDALLEIYDGDTVRKSTKQDGLILIEGTLSILLLSQSNNLTKFSNLHKSGLWQRFLYVDLPEKFPVHEKDSEIDDTHLAVFNHLQTELYNLVIDKQKVELSVSTEAKKIFKEWEIFTQRRGNENHPDVFDDRYGDARLYEAITKCHSHAIRIAGLLCLWNSMESLDSIMVSAEDMKAGIAIAEWFYDRRVADSLNDVYDIQDERLEAVIQFCDMDGTVTASKLCRQTTFFGSDDTKSAKLYLEGLKKRGVLRNKNGRSNTFEREPGSVTY